MKKVNKMWDEYLKELKQCPNCKQEVMYGDMIWLNGECLCPSCYQHKRNKYDELKRQGYEEAKRKYGE